MARTVRDSSLDTRTARLRLKPRGTPYYRAIEPGLHLGYRKPKGRARQRVAGAWVVRLYVGEQSYRVERIGVADDFDDANGVTALSFAQAQDVARKRLAERAASVLGIAHMGPLTVRDAMSDYVGFLNRSRQSGRDTAYQANRFILPSLGDVKIAHLTTARIEQWLDGIVDTAPRHRTFDPKDPEARRRRKVSANRLLTILRAALNRQFRAGAVSTDTPWRRVERFEGVDAPRLRFLSMEECVRLVNAAGPILRPLVVAALHSGARYGELARLEVRDFIPDPGNLHIRTSKTGKGRFVVLSEEGRRFFGDRCKGRLGDELMFTNLSGQPWSTAHQCKPLKDACRHGKISPPVNFHSLRHTYASHAAMLGMPMLVLARQLGHSSTRMTERVYAHLSSGYVRAAVLAGAPQFGLATDDKVVKPLRARR